MNAVILMTDCDEGREQNINRVENGDGQGLDGGTRSPSNDSKSVSKSATPDTENPPKPVGNWALSSAQTVGTLGTRD